MKKIKNILYFLKWWANEYKNNFDPLYGSMKSSLIFLVVGTLTIHFSPKFAFLMWGIAIFLLLSLLFFLFIIKPIKDAYNRYKREQRDTFNILRRG